MAGQSITFQQPFERLHMLDEETLAEVDDFVEFLSQKKGRRDISLFNVVRERALPSVTLEQVREDSGHHHRLVK